MELKEFFIKWAKLEDLSFKMKDRDITAEDVFSSRGLMPAIAKRADKICRLIFDYGVGVSFKKYESSTLGEEVKFDSKLPEALVLHIFFYVVNELLQKSKDKNGNLVVDELLYE